MSNLLNSLLDSYSLNCDLTKDSFKNPFVYPQVIDGKLTVKFKVPGYEKNEIKISFENPNDKYYSEKINGLLTVKADNQEFGTKTYNSKFNVPIDSQSISANLKNGILTVTACVDSKKTKTKFIEIEA